jgi:hypothetical protein
MFPNEQGKRADDMTKRMARCSGAALLAGAMAWLGLAPTVKGACNPPDGVFTELLTFKVEDSSNPANSVEATPFSNPETIYVCEGAGGTAQIQISANVFGDPAHIGWRVEQAHGPIHDLVNLYLPPSTLAPAVSPRNEGNLGSMIWTGCNPVLTLYPSDSDRIFHVKAFCDERRDCTFNDSDTYYKDSLPAESIIEVCVVVLKVDLEGYEAWRKNDGDMVPAVEEEAPGFLVTRRISSLSVAPGSTDGAEVDVNPVEATLVVKGLGISSGCTRWLRFSDSTKVDLWEPGAPDPIALPVAGDYPVPGDVNVPRTYDITMRGVWGLNTTVSVTLIVKDSAGVPLDCQDTVRLLRPVVMALGDSTTYGYQTVAITPKYIAPWVTYPGSAASWTGFSGEPGNIEYQGWRGYLSYLLGDGFAWDGEDVGDHGPEHMGYGGAKCENLNALIDGYGGRLYPKQALLNDPCYAIVIYFIGLNDMNKMSASVLGAFDKWKMGLDYVLTAREGRGKTVIVGVTLPRLGDGYASPADVATMNGNIEAFDILIRGYTVPATYTHAKYGNAHVELVPHAVGDDHLHFLATGYQTIERKIKSGIYNTLQN